MSDTREREANAGSSGEGGGGGPSSPASAAAVDFTCSICLEVATEPVVTRCGHLFDWPCLDRWLTTSGTQECPTCKGLVRRDVVGDVIPIFGKGRTSATASNGASHTSPSGPRPPAPAGAPTAAPGGSSSSGSDNSSGPLPSNPRPRANREDAPPRANHTPLFGGLRNGGFFLFAPGLMSIEFFFVAGLLFAAYYAVPWRRWLGWDAAAPPAAPATPMDPAEEERRRNWQYFFFILAAVVMMVALGVFLDDSSDSLFIDDAVPSAGARRSAVRGTATGSMRMR